MNKLITIGLALIASLMWVLLVVGTASKSQIILEINTLDGKTYYGIFVADATEHSGGFDGRYSCSDLSKSACNTGGVQSGCAASRALSIIAILTGIFAMAICVLQFMGDFASDFPLISAGDKIPTYVAPMAFAFTAFSIFVVWALQSSLMAKFDSCQGGGIPGGRYKFKHGTGFALLVVASLLGLVCVVLSYAAIRSKRAYGPAWMDPYKEDGQKPLAGDNDGLTGGDPSDEQPFTTEYENMD